MLALFSLGGGELVLVTALLFFIVPLGLLSFVFWIWMLIDAIKNEGLNEGEKIAWVLVIALTHLLGAIIYFFAGRGSRRSTA
ncbi:MAG TPA: PLDc N-terminal domain-containing protein [Verrucomicrobiae bacterium]|jgi:hypothetical protein|nr:PLDc N-terminal domain-containing protein [Verrucomicrobiae bacterium]